MNTVGYMEGVDPLVLTRLAVSGVGTLPVSNGFDNHGKFINNITERDGVNVICGHLHKFLATQRQGFFVQDLLQSCTDCDIPVLVIVPEADQVVAARALSKVSGVATVVDPAHLYDVIRARLGLE